MARFDTPWFALGTARRAGFVPARRFATRGPYLPLWCRTCRPRRRGAAGGRVPRTSNSKVRTRCRSAVEAKYKIDRRMGENIWGRPKSPVNRREYGPGQHGQRRKGKVSDFGLQLRAKQKLKGYYGNITEKQFRRIYDEADPPEGRHLREPDRPAGEPPRRGRLPRQVRADRRSPRASSSTTATSW